MLEQTFKTGMNTNKVIGGLSGGFFTFYCEKCGARVKIRFLGQELMVPKFESYCKCGEIHQFKAIITDIPNKKIENAEEIKPAQTKPVPTKPVPTKPGQPSP